MKRRPALFLSVDCTLSFRRDQSLAPSLTESSFIRLERLPALRVTFIIISLIRGREMTVVTWPAGKRKERYEVKYVWLITTSATCTKKKRNFLFQNVVQNSFHFHPFSVLTLSLWPDSFHCVCACVNLLQLFFFHWSFFSCLRIRQLLSMFISSSRCGLISCFLNTCSKQKQVLFLMSENERPVCL